MAKKPPTFQCVLDWAHIQVLSTCELKIKFLFLERVAQDSPQLSVLPRVTLNFDPPASTKVLGLQAFTAMPR